MWGTKRHDEGKRSNRFGNERERLDANSRETIELLQRYDDAPSPDSVFLDRLERTLLDAAQHASTPLRATPLVSSNDRASTRGQRTWLPVFPATSRRSGRWMPHVATALLLLITLSSIYIAFQPLSHKTIAPIGGKPTAIPTPIPIPGVTIDNLGAATLPINLSTNTVEVWRVEMATAILAPGEGGSQPPNDPGSGTGVELVIEGTLTVSSDAPLRVTRIDGTTSDIPPGTEVTVGPGESVQHLDIAAAQTWRNPGTSQTVLLGVGVFALDGYTGSFTGLFVDFGGVTGKLVADERLDDWITFGLPEEPVTATFRRLTIAPGAALPPASDITPTLRWVDSGVIGWTLVGDGIATRPPNKPLMRYFSGQRVPWIPTDPGVQVILSNPSQNDVSVLWEVILTPLAASLATTSIT